MWLKLPRVKNTITILENAIKKYKVLYVPGAPFFVNPDDGLDCLRLNFSYSDPETIDLAMQRLGALLEEESNK
jgi:DNA-binding transcriptional MocR family regulator